jgi:hypothetical protein
LRDLVRKYLRSTSFQGVELDNRLESDTAIGGVAAMVAGLVQGNTVLELHLENWLTTTTGEYASLGLDTRRAVVATLALRTGTKAGRLVIHTNGGQTNCRGYSRSAWRALVTSYKYSTIQFFNKSVSDQPESVPQRLYLRLAL